MSKTVAMTGNTAAYTGAALCHPDLIAAYPITPQSSVVEGLAGMVYNGKLNSNFVQVESEHSAMSVVQGAAAAGGRVFTATSAQGLALMYPPYAERIADRPVDPRRMGRFHGRAQLPRLPSDDPGGKP